MRFGLLATFTAALAIVTWDELKHNQRVPHPDRYVQVAIVWAILGIFGELGAPELATIFGVGYVVAMLYRYYRAPGSPPKSPTPLPSSPPASPHLFGS